MDIFSSYGLLIEASVILIISFFFSEVSKKTSIPSVLLLIILGVGLKLALDFFEIGSIDFFPYLEVLGIVGLIMIVLEAALELKLEKDKIIPITKALVIALVCLMLSTWVTAEILAYFIDGMERGWTAWLYATPLSILSSAIIIPSVTELRKDKKEFHIYEGTFSDILGIMLFYFIEGQLHSSHNGDHGGGAGFGAYGLNILITIVLSIIFSYLIVIVFQNIRNSVKLFLLIAVLLLLYSVGKLMHLSSLIIILIFGLVTANMDLFFSGRLKRFLNKDKAHDVYHGLHVITMETAFVVRTFFFVVFGLTITFESLMGWDTLYISFILLAIIYVIRFIILRMGIGRDLIPQLWIAPRGLITILLFYAIPKEFYVEEFSQGILLYIILGTSLIMTFAMIYDKNRSNAAIKKTRSLPVGNIKWRVPGVGREE